MKWAQTESFLSPYCLAQSGMPAPDPGILGGVEAADLGPPPADALPALRGELARLFDVEPERLLVTAGASGAMHLLAQRYYGPGTRVVTELPSYEPFRALPELHGAETRMVRRGLDTGWALDPAAVERELAGARPGHVALATPHNPTGHVLSPGEVAHLAGLAGRAGGVLISNESYMELAPPGERVHAFALAENAFSIGTLTKAYGLGALRIGWIVAGAGVAGEIDVLEDLQFLDILTPATPSLRLARAALDRLDALLAPVRHLERHSRPHLVRWLAEEPAVEGVAPALGLTAFARVHGVQDTVGLARHLAREHQVDVAPGEYFGAPGHVRVGYGVPEETLVEGLARLSRGIRAYAP